uniref:tRNA wybutosine-synthesizing protein 3 homolog n=1 Tax=Xenopus tropicalis TaxID=8364 RepID=A0A803J9B3_XENTR
MEKQEAFSHWKQQSLRKADVSKKGSVDEDIEETVRLINQQERYFTTSSCSGRVIMINETLDSSIIQKQNCSWLFVTHQLCKPDDVFAALKNATGDVVLKFEPFVLHVQCHKLEDAQILHGVAINSGFRNSGITVGKKGKIIMSEKPSLTKKTAFSLKYACICPRDSDKRKLQEEERLLTYTPGQGSFLLTGAPPGVSGSTKYPWLGSPSHTKWEVFGKPRVYRISGADSE